MDFLLSRLCQLSFVQTQWLGTDGQVRQVPEETLRRILNILDVDTSSIDVMEKEIQRLEEEYWQDALPLTPFVRHQDHGHMTALEMICRKQDAKEDHHILLEFEHGETREFTVVPYDQHVLEEREVGGVSKIRYNFYFPSDLPLGYHRITYRFGSYSLIKTLIVAPGQSYIPDGFWDQKKWGMGTHIYGLKSNKPSYIGDFQHLSQLVAWAKQEGAHFVGINPLHALYLHQPEIAAPYSPSSRLWLNPIYAVTGKEETPEETPIQIDYAQAYINKIRALRTGFKEFSKDTENMLNFTTWVQKEGLPLMRYALFSVLSFYFEGKTPNQWPKEYRTPSTTASRQFASEHKQEISFHCWLQYIAHQQLSHIAKEAKSLGIGLYGDLAVGITSFGADAWCYPEVIINDVHFGAPPDAFSKAGQDWAICPFNPLALHKEGFKTFITMVQKNMQYYGALRIDHVMGLKQLYWIPDGLSAKEGAYVGNPYEIMLAIIALESHRNQCLVIGEDLGTVPWGMREQMDQENVFGYRVSWFETWAETGYYKRPDAYTGKALATVSTHDLPTVAAFWLGRDLNTRNNLKAYNTQEEQEYAKQERKQAKIRLLDALKDQGLIEGNRTCDNVSIEEVTHALHAFVARSNSYLMFAQLDDLSLEETMLNMPGIAEYDYPNWRRRLSYSIEDYKQSERVQKILQAIKQERGLL